MREFKNKKRLTGVQHLVMGTGSFTVELAFLPDHLTASFVTSVAFARPGNDGKADTGDTIYWELTGAPDAYVFTVHYTCTHPRDIRWLAAKLPKNAEIISH